MNFHTFDLLMTYWYYGQKGYGNWQVDFTSEDQHEVYRQVMMKCGCEINE